MLRAVRVPAETFDQSLVMTPYGQLLRWGEGWWLRPDAADGEAVPPGVAEQLRAIDACDPSRSLGPRRP